MNRATLIKYLDDVENLLVDIEVKKDIDYKRILRVNKQSYKAILDYIKKIDREENNK